MPGKGRVFISHAQEDAARCKPLLAVLDAWDVPYVFEEQRKGADLRLSERAQAAVAESAIFLRICTNAIRRSYWMSLEAGAFLGLQSEDHRQGRGDIRTLVNLILDRDYTLEPFDRAGVLIDATKEPVAAWVNRLREALGLPPLADAASLGLERMLTASGVTRRRLIAAGAAAAVVAVAGGAVGVASSGILKPPKGFVESTPTATPPLRSAIKPLWSVGLGREISATLAVADGVVFAGAWDGKLYALDARNKGKRLWSFSVSSDSEIYAPPVVANGLVYTHAHVNGQGATLRRLYALRVADGTVAWDTTPTGNAQIGSFSAPLVKDGVLYLPAVYTGLGDTFLVTLLDAVTGKILPITCPAVLTSSSPTIAGKLLYIGAGDGTIYALDITKQLTAVWRANVMSGPGATSTPVAGVDTSNTSITSSPAVANGVVYIGSLDHRLYALDAATGKILWHYEAGDQIAFSSPAVAGGVVYIGSDDHALHAVDAATGKGLWKYSTGGKIKSSPAVANGEVYVGSYDHNVYALDAKSGTLLRTYATGNQVFASPRIVDGVLYIGSYDNYVYAFPTA